MVETCTSKNQTVAIVLTSDHGSFYYNHGSSVEIEHHTPLIIFSNYEKYNKSAASKNPLIINQIDICPGLAALIGVEIPKMSFGSLRAPFTNFLTKKSAECYTKENSNQLKFIRKVMAKIYKL